MENKSGIRAKLQGGEVEVWDWIGCRRRQRWNDGAAVAVSIGNLITVMQSMVQGARVGFLVFVSRSQVALRRAWIE